jgi:hypothetical protein
MTAALRLRKNKTLREKYKEQRVLNVSKKAAMVPSIATWN